MGRLKKTHNRVGRFAAAFESIQRQLQLESHPTARGSVSGSHSFTPVSPLLSAARKIIVDIRKDRGCAIGFRLTPALKLSRQSGEPKLPSTINWVVGRSARSAY